MSAKPMLEQAADEPCRAHAARPDTACGAQCGDDDPPLGVEALHSVPMELIAGRAD